MYRMRRNYQDGTWKKGMSLTTQSYTAGEAGFKVNSHLIIGEKSVILIDAQFTRSEARGLVKKIRGTGKELKAVFITHGHPDHYFGNSFLMISNPK